MNDTSTTSEDRPRTEGAPSPAPGVTAPEGLCPPGSVTVTAVTTPRDPRVDPRPGDVTRSKDGVEFTVIARQYGDVVYLEAPYSQQCSVALRTWREDGLSDTVVFVDAAWATLGANPSGRLLDEIGARLARARDEPASLQSAKTDRRLVWLDVETTGLDPEHHEIVEVGLVEVEADLGLHEVGWTQLRMRPEHPERIDPEAAAVNGYTADGWADSVSQVEGLTRIRPLLEGAVLGGHHVAFDRAFVLNAYRRAGLEPPTLSRRTLDTTSIGAPLVLRGQAAGFSLDELAAAVGLLPRTGPHRALDDARRSLHVARWAFRPYADGDGPPTTEVPHG